MNAIKVVSIILGTMTGMAVCSFMQQRQIDRINRDMQYDMLRRNIDRNVDDFLAYEHFRKEHIDQKRKERMMQQR